MYITLCASILISISFYIHFRFTIYLLWHFQFLLRFVFFFFVVYSPSLYYIFFVHLVQNAHNFRMANEHFSIRSIEISFFTSFCRRHRSSGELLQLHSLIKPTKENQIHYVFVQRYLLCLLVLWCIIEMPYRRIVDVMSKRP